MLEKASLHDIKKNNRNLIIQALISSETMSRIEIAHSTKLSPSTVTTLVSELLDDNVLIETGMETSTGGRRRKQIAINPNYGVIAVVEAGCTGTSIHFFDMLLSDLGGKTLTPGRVTGNRLLTAAVSAIYDFFGTENIPQEYLAGIGLLFQEDTQGDDFSVIFSTSLSSDVITLREALYSEFQVPVLEDYSVAYSITEALAAAAGSLSKNSAHISIARSVLASVVIDGKPLPMKNGQNADLTGIIRGFDDISSKTDGNTLSLSGLAGRVAALISLFCAMFPLDEVFIFGNKIRSNGFLQMLDSTLNKIMPDPPLIRAAELRQDEFASRLAEKIRKNVLLLDNP